MKKLMVIAALASVSPLAAICEEAPYTEAEIVELANKTANGGWYHFDNKRIEPKYYAKIDAILSASTNVVRFCPDTFPQAYEKWMLFASAKSPNYVAFEAKVRTDGGDAAWMDDKLGVDQIDRIATTTWCVPGSLDSWKKGILYFAKKRVKRQIRAEGKSFVTKNGVNPVQERLNAITTAFDAPRLAGLKEALAGVGYNMTVDVGSLLPTDGEVQRLMGEVMSGEKDFTKDRQGILKYCLGVTAYNAFVKTYNGD